MTTDATSDQSAYWNGEVGQRWARNQRVLDAVFAPLTDALFDRVALRPGARILDIGCGAGETALIAARRVGTRGRVTAVDLSAPLLEAARERVTREAAAGAPIAWVEADAQTHDFGDAAFEEALSRFGVMFFDDSERAFANIRRTLAPGGRLTFLCWRRIEENAWVSVPREIVLRMVPDFPSGLPGGPGPFRFAEQSTLMPILQAAGFRDIAFEPVDRDLILSRSAKGSAREAADAAAEVAAEFGPIARILRESGPELRRAAREAIAEGLIDRAVGGTVSLGAACWLVSALR